MYAKVKYITLTDFLKIYILTFALKWVDGNIFYPNLKFTFLTLK